MTEKLSDPQPRPISRILRDLALGGLDEPEIETVAAWLAIDAPAPPSHLLQQVIEAGRGAYATP